MNKTQKISIIAVVLIALIAVALLVFYFDLIPIFQKKEAFKVKFDHDSEGKSVIYEAKDYKIVVDYKDKFKITGLSSGENNILSKDKGIHLSHSIRGKDFTSLGLARSPEVTLKDIGEDEYEMTFSFEDDYITYGVTMAFCKEYCDLKIERTFKEDTTLVGQGFPSINLCQDAIENIRWHRSGSNFQVGGYGANMRNFLSGGASYLNGKGEHGYERGNIRRAMEDITFSLISLPKDKFAFSFDGKTDGEFSTCVQRYEDGDLRPLEINIFKASKLEVNGSTDGWGSYQGKSVSQGAEIYKPIKYEKGNIDIIEFRIKATVFEDYFKLGKLNGIDSENLSYALNNYGRLMILDYNMGSAVESPNYHLEIPALEQHWNSNLIGILFDDAAIESQLNGLRIIKDKLQARDGHITSPYPWISSDSWGSNYSDMMPGYVLAVSYMYNLTGNRDFLDEMVESCIKALEAQEKRYLDGRVYLCKNLNTGSVLNMNDYWEHTAGKYNGYTSAMYYEALMSFSDLLTSYYNSQYGDLAKSYKDLAGLIKKDFNEMMWSEATSSFLYGTDNLDIQYLPVQGAAIRGNIVDTERAKEMVGAIERMQSVFNLPFHVMNVLDILQKNIPADQSDDHNKSMLGMNGGYYGAPAGDYYAGFPIYGDRTLIPRYINRFTDVYTKTGFVGTTALKRDGVSPADYGWYDSMPTLVYPIWGLYTYGYGFQPNHDRLNIAPFIDESMVGSEVYYRFRQTDMEVIYHTLYDFEIRLEKELDTDIYIQFINQLAGKEYEVSIDGKKEKIVANQDGSVSVKVTKLNSRIKLIKPEDETLTIDSLIGFTTIPSSTLDGDHVTLFWSSAVTDGRDNKYWTPKHDDNNPYIILCLGGKASLKNLTLKFKENKGLKYTIEGTNDPKLEDWMLIVKADKKKTTDLVRTHKLKGTYHYIRIRFIDTEAKDIKLLQIET